MATGLTRDPGPDPAAAEANPATKALAGVSGELQVLLVKREPQSLPQRVSVGPGSELSVAAGSELWLRINDFEGQRKGNSGSYRVQLQQADGP